ncbi:MAG TPA: hypothetical protein VFA18_13980 [Gemmataceae bacterium]|nr:hypothetical protein [Gemmataceae bacterium]
MTRRLGIALTGLLAFSGLLASPLRAADLDKVQGSLSLIPGDVAFYHTMLRNKEQLDLVAKSRAWAKLTSQPLVQAAWKEVVKQYNEEGGRLATFRQLISQPENKELVELLGDAVANEIFCFGNNGWADLLDLFGQINRANQLTQFESLLHGGGGNDPTHQAKAALKVLARNVDLLKMPDVVIGFRLTDPKKGEAQLKRLENLLNAILGQIPALQGRFKRVQVNGGSYLSLTLDGQMVPWNQVPFGDLEDKPGEFDALKRKLVELKLSINLGLRDNYLLLCLSESTAPLARFGSPGAGQRLVDRPEFKPLAQYADKRLTSIGYISQSFRTRLASYGAANMDSLFEMAQLGLTKADIPQEKRAKIEADLKSMTAEMKKSAASEGAALSFAFLTDRGSEGYSYDWSKHTDLDSSKPLTLLHHVGEAPIFAAVSRSRPDPEGYKAFVQGIQKAYGYFADLVAPRLEGEAKQYYEKAVKEIFPLLKRLDEVTGNLLLPSLDGQIGLVLDAKWTSTQWLKQLPATAKPLPMLEDAMLLGVSDSDKLRKALSEYRTIINELLAKIRDFVPPGHDVPEIQVPQPRSEQSPTGNLFIFSLPKEWGLDPQVAPTLGLSRNVFVVTPSQAYTQRLLASKPLKTDGGPLANLNRPLGAAAYCNWPALIDALTPWVEFGISMIPEDQIRLPLAGDNATGKNAKEEILREVRVVLEVLKCFRGFTSATYRDGDAQVTHSESLYKDVAR